MRLILIRHGETTGNEQGLYQGAMDLSLSEKGIMQCLEVKEKLKGFKIDKVYSSPLKRAMESANIIFEEPSIEKIEQFREINFGLWEGRNYKQISIDYKKQYQEFLGAYKCFTFPEGESFENFYLRVSNGINRLCEVSKDETIAIVAHGGTIRAILCELLSFGVDGFYKINIFHGCYSLISVYEGVSIIEEINK